MLDLSSQKRGTNQHGNTVSHAPARDVRSLRLLNQYRLFLIFAMGAVYYLADGQHTLGQRDATLFEIAHLAYAVIALLFIYLLNLGKPSKDTQFYLQNYIDILFIVLIMYTCGGVSSGIGILLLITIALISQLTTTRLSLLFAAIASTVVLSVELFAQLRFGASAANFERTALLGSLLFIIAWLFTVPMKRLASREFPQSEELHAALNVKQIATLNEEIIRELDSGVLVIDSSNQVQLINDTARELLAAEFTPLPVHVGRLCSSLFDSIQHSRSTKSDGTRPFTIDATGTDVLPQFIGLSGGGVLIKLDDHGNIRRQLQQLKMASLGKLSASIAHEIRNPLGAISHSVQLLEESETLQDEDLNLLGIARKHTQRINRIVEDVLQLSNHQELRSDPLDLKTQIDQFCARFTTENQLPVDQINADCDIACSAIFDPGHFDQVLWNLCTNALLHNGSDSISINIHCYQSTSSVIVLDVTDNGKGIAEIQREQLFEPFYSTHHAGSGLGLYIIRELCALNKGQLACLESDSGAHFRLTLSSINEQAA
ncbi:MAG: ATP-binding protein [Granulosicoccaceae bacterium]